MNVELSDITLLEDTYAYACRKSDKENAKLFKREVKKLIKKIKNIVNADIENMSDDEFYKLLVSIYSILLDTEDYLELFSKKNNKEYIGIRRLLTTMTFINEVREGHGKKFDYWDQLYQVEYVVAISKDMEFDSNKIYSKEDIRKLVSDKSILILKQEKKPIDRPIEDFEEEKYQPFSIEFDLDKNSIDFTSDSYFDVYMTMLREKFTKKKILKDMQKYALSLKMEIENITNDTIYPKLSQLCKNWYTDSNASSEFKKLQIKLNIQ